jgi:hypothetical protein
VDLESSEVPIEMKGSDDEVEISAVQSPSIKVVSAIVDIVQDDIATPSLEKKKDTPSLDHTKTEVLFSHILFLVLSI